MSGRMLQRRQVNAPAQTEDGKQSPLFTPSLTAEDPTTIAAGRPEAGPDAALGIVEPELAAPRPGHTLSGMRVFAAGETEIPNRNQDTLAATPHVAAPGASPAGVNGQVSSPVAAPTSWFGASTGIEVVVPTLHPPAASGTSPASETRVEAGRALPGQAGESPGAVAVVRDSLEGQDAAMDPVETEDEKVNYLAATAPVVNDLTPAGSSGLTRIRVSDVAISGTVYDDAGQWKIRVTAASTTIHWGINTTGYQIPNPTDGGNITQDNWQTVVTELQGYQTRQAAGAWHHPDATRTHELNHVSWFSGEILRTWPTIEADIQSHGLGASASVSQAQAQSDMQTYLDQKRRDWFNAYGVAPEPPAYAAGQAVLNGIITQIQSYARSKGWTS